jgi:hypothetical protein
MGRLTTLIFHLFFWPFSTTRLTRTLDLNACAVLHEGSSSVEAITTRTGRVELVDERIVAMRMGDMVQTVEDARANLEACSRLAAPDRKPFLADIRLARPLMPEVRRVYMGESLVAFAAMAMLVRATPLGRTMGNVYLKIARPAIPTKLFTQESKALAWLRAAK